MLQLDSSTSSSTLACMAAGCSVSLVSRTQQEVLDEGAVILAELVYACCATTMTACQRGTEHTEKPGQPNSFSNSLTLFLKEREREPRDQRSKLTRLRWTGGQSTAPLLNRTISRALLTPGELLTAYAPHLTATAACDRALRSRKR